MRRKYKYSPPCPNQVVVEMSVKTDVAEFAGWPKENVHAFLGGIAKVLAAKGDAMPYSATVRLTLEVGEFKFNLSHVGGDEIILRNVTEPIGPCEGTLVIQVDDMIERIPVSLPDGLVGPGAPVKYSKLEPAPLTPPPASPPEAP